MTDDQFAGERRPVKVTHWGITIRLATSPSLAWASRPRCERDNFESLKEVTGCLHILQRLHTTGRAFWAPCAMGRGDSCVALFFSWVSSVSLLYHTSCTHLQIQTCSWWIEHPAVTWMTESGWWRQGCLNVGAWTPVGAAHLGSR